MKVDLFSRATFPIRTGPLLTQRKGAPWLALPPRADNTPQFRWLGSAIRDAILGGRLRPGTRLPSTRELARQYRLSRGTIVSAFDQLRAEGYVTGSVGSGTFVSRVLPDELLHVRRAAGRVSPARKQSRRTLSDFARRVAPFPEREVGPVRAFRANLPALDLFPSTLWAQVASRRLRRASTQLLRGGAPVGYRPLQDALADYLTTARGVNCTAEQIVIVSGVQEALDLVARVVLDTQDRVCMENPGYIGASLVFEAVGARLIPHTVDDEGVQLPRGQARGARLAYMTPAHQFPLGISMSLTRRLAWLEWARSTNALIFEDDYDSEYRFSGRPVPALQGLDSHGVVLFAGSFNKVLFPSLRVGYLVVPSDLVDVIVATKSVGSRHVPLLDQAVLSDFMAEGHFGRHVRRMREVYAGRRALLLEFAERYLRGMLTITGVEAGLQTAGWLLDDVDGETVARAAAEHDVEVTPLSRFASGPLTQEGLQLGFAAVEDAEFRRGVRDLAASLESLRRNNAKT